MPKNISRNIVYSGDQVFGIVLQNVSFFYRLHTVWKEAICGPGDVIVELKAEKENASWKDLALFMDLW